MTGSVPDSLYRVATNANAGGQTPNSTLIHKHGLWIYGVVVALTIREALLRFLSAYFALPGLLAAVPWTTNLGAFRVALVVLMVIRFYLGSAYHFSQADLPRRAVVTDFLVGFLHYVLFFAWAISLHNYDAPLDRRLTFFMTLLLTVLLYDVTWWLITKMHRPRPSDEAMNQVAQWTFMNVGTAAVSLLIYLSGMFLKANWATTEICAYMPVFVVSIFDLAALATGGPNLIMLALRRLTEGARQSATA